MDDIVEVGLSGNWAEALDQLGEILQTGVLRSGGNAASEVFQVEAALRAPVYAGKVHTYKTGKKAGRQNANPGQLRDAIYRAFSQGGSHYGKVTYSVSWNHTKAPHGHWLENGNSRHPAKPFLTPAYEAAKYRAISAGLTRMGERFNKEVQKIR